MHVSNLMTTIKSHKLIKSHGKLDDQYFLVTKVYIYILQNKTVSAKSMKHKKPYMPSVLTVSQYDIQCIQILL